MNARLVAAAVLIFLIVLFAAQNYKVVELRFLFWTLSMSRVLLLALVFVVGGVCGWLLKSFTSR
jgi:uncharacterized integral membrane protein